MQYNMIHNVTQINVTQCDILWYDTTLFNINALNLLSSLQVLSKTLTTLHKDDVVDKDEPFLPVKCILLNPKSLSQGELYGEYRESSEWKDGILSKIMRDCVTDFNSGSEGRKWVILDGPVDALWIEVRGGSWTFRFLISTHICYISFFISWIYLTSSVIPCNASYLFLFLFFYL